MTNNYTNIFGGNAVVPAQPSYLALSISANTTLMWPTESTEGNDYVAAMLDVTATAGGLQLAMPSALLGSAGPATIVTNVGSNSFTLTDGDASPIVSIATTVSYLISLTSNATEAGTWRAYQLGSTSSSATASALADGLTIQANGSVLQTEQLTFGANTVFTSAKRGQLGLFTTAANTAYNCPTSGSCGAGWWCDLTNQTTANTLTLNRQGGDTINGLTSAVLNPGTSMRLICTGAAFVLSGSEFLSTNALMIGGGANATPTQIATGATGQILTSNGPNAAPSFQTLTAAVVPVLANGIINGGCRVSTRGSGSISTTPTYLAVNQVRQWVSGAGAAVTSGSSTNGLITPGTSTGSACTFFAITTTGATATINWGIRIESLDAAPFVNQTAVFQCKVFTGLNTNYVITINKPTLVNNYGAITQIGQSANIPVVGGPTWTPISFSTSMGSCSFGIEIIVSTLIGATIGTSFLAGDFGLFLGTTAISPFPNPLYADDLQACQRYLPFFPIGSVANLTPYAGYGTSANLAKIVIPYLVPPRVAPTAISIDTSTQTTGIYDLVNGANNSTAAPTFVASTTSALTIQATSATKVTNNSLVFFGSGSSTALVNLMATGAEL